MMAIACVVAGGRSSIYLVMVFQLLVHFLLSHFPLTAQMLLA
jgi:hypothetical protein